MSDSPAQETAPNHRVLPNGAVYDMDKKRIIKAPYPNTITQENASDFHRMAAETRLQGKLAAQAGIADLVKTKSAVAAWRHIVNRQGWLAADVKNNGYASVKAAEFVGKATGFMPDRSELQASQAMPSSGAAILLSQDAVRELAELLSRRHTEQEVDDD